MTALLFERIRLTTYHHVSFDNERKGAKARLPRTCPRRRFRCLEPR